MTRPPSAGPPPGDEVRAIREELDRTRHELREALERLRVAQGQIVQAGRLSALGQLVAGVAHEMNNPLTSVIGHAQLVHQQLLRRPDLAAELTELLPDIDNIFAEASRAGRIVRNLLLFARRQGAARNFQDIEFLCEQIVELRSYELRMNGVEITTSFARGLPAVFAEGSQIQQVLLNLVLNAEQAVRQSATRRIELIVTAEPDCGAVLLEVRDSGEGIDRASLGRVFEPFYTTRPVGEGTGLGLSIARSIVRDHGGQIWAESQPHVRTSFFIRLPATLEPAVTGARDRVIVLHEDPEIRSALTSAFAGWGFQAEPIVTLADAVSDSTPAIILADAAAVRRDRAGWDAAWARWGEATALIAVSLAPADRDPAEAALRARARATVGPAGDLCELRHALAIARSIAPAREPALE